MPRCATKMSINYTTHLVEAESLWRKYIPCETIFDLWEVRMAFHRHFCRPLRFLYLSDDSADKLFLPLSWVEEKNVWCFFPGETWHTKTWLEQNRLLPSHLDTEILRRELGADFQLRYLSKPCHTSADYPIDETGYLFHPPDYQYQIQNWWNSFSHRRARLLRRELAAVEEKGVIIRYGEEELFNLMVQMNTERFAADSFFADSRFREGFRGMIETLSQLGLLRVTSVYCGDQLAALDFGAVFKERYTLLAGGTDARFPGVAKLINLHHMQWACDERLDEVDFLCGDFCWKPLFHLKPRPLYLFSSL